MIKYLQKLLRALGEFETKHFTFMIVFLILFTSVAIVGITKVELESDFSAFNPEGVPIIELNERIYKEFSDFQSFLVIVELDDSEIGSQITDIRDPEVMNFLVSLDKNLRAEQKIQNVRSAALFFSKGVPEDTEEIKTILDAIPQSNSLFNKGKSVTIVLLEADVGGDNVKVKEITEKVREIVERSSQPSGVKARVTGEPALGNKIFEFIVRDGLVTLIITTVVIFLLLLIITRNLKESLIIIVPVLLGVTWTIGGLGWFGIPITVATAAIGAMLLGLGTEYSIFLSSRFKEERQKHDYKEAIKRALGTTGASTTSSGITTMIGFFALTASFFPMLSDMGFSLGMGIGFVLSSTMLTGPIAMIIGEKLTKKNSKEKKENNKESKVLVIFEAYGKFVSKRTWIVIILMIIITWFVFTGSQKIINEEIDFFNVLPEELEELKAYEVLQNEFEDTSTVRLYVSLDKTYSNSNEPIDIRDPRVIKYVDILTQKAEQMDYIVNVGSISKLEKNSVGEIPGSLSEQKQLIKEFDYRNYINEDFSAMQIFINVDQSANDLDIISQVNEIVKNTAKPAGVLTRPAGGMIENYEMNKMNGPDSSKTGMIAFGMIILFLLVLTRSIKYTILPLFTVILAILWILGLMGHVGVPFNSIVSAVISMTIGIGIDFGIQLSQRFKQELGRGFEKRKAMTETLKYTLYPMVITVVAALIGFQAMKFGKLNLMGDLGTVMSFAIVSSMIVAVSLVAGLILVFERNKSHKSLKNKKVKE